MQIVKEVIENPELIYEGRHLERKAVRYVTKAHLGPKYLLVVYREESSRKAITAYFTSDLKRIKVNIVWKA